MKHLIRAWGLTTLLFLGLSALAVESLTLRVDPRVALAPASFMAYVRVEPHPDNRLLRVIVVDPYGLVFQTSERSLDGENSRPPFPPFKIGPLSEPGDYNVVAVLRSSQDIRGRQVRTFTVGGFDKDSRPRPGEGRE